MTRLRGLFFASASIAAVSAILVACSDDSSERPAFEGDSTDAARPEASLPQPGSNDGGSSDATPDVARPPIERPPFDSADVPVTCASEPCAVELVAGENHFCARLSDRTVKCWGDNYNGQVGTGTTDRSAGYGPTTVAGISDVKQISASEYATCAVLGDDTMKCWGGNRQGQLGLRASPGLSDYSQHATATAVAFADPVTRVDVGRRAVCALPTAGGLVCWGGNDKLQLTRADAGTVGGPGPADMKAFSIVRTVGTETSVFGLTSDGHVVSWGATSGRESSINPDPTPNVIPTLEKVTSFAAGAAHACAIAAGELYCWGAGGSGVLGTGIPNNEPVPMHAPIVNDKDLSLYPQRVTASSTRTCVRITDGTVQCTGDDSFGALGAGTSGGGVSLLTKATSYTGYAVQVATSALATCALDKNGTVQCWGGNGYGDLGQRSQDYDPHPLPVSVTF
jgi:alpha-tubulin suppressor-like RCC1 family protein